MEGSSRGKVAERQQGDVGGYSYFCMAGRRLIFQRAIGMARPPAVVPNAEEEARQERRRQVTYSLILFNVKIGVKSCQVQLVIGCEFIVRICFKNNCPVRLEYY